LIVLFGIPIIPSISGVLLPPEGDFKTSTAALVDTSYIIAIEEKIKLKMAKKIGKKMRRLKFTSAPRRMRRRWRF
jgi:hypothetical protein